MTFKGEPGAYVALTVEAPLNVGHVRRLGQESFAHGISADAPLHLVYSPTRISIFDDFEAGHQTLTSTTECWIVAGDLEAFRIDLAWDQ